MATINDAGVLDFHTHWRPEGWQGGGTLVEGEPDPREDLAALAGESADNGVDLRALSAPVEQLFGPDGEVTTSDIAGVNERLTEAVQRHPDFLGLATIDAFAGDAGADQVRYAVADLGLQGIVLDSSRHGKFLSAPEVFPTLATAAELAVPVFVHPVAAPQSAALREAAGRAGYSAGRGLQNAVAFLSALHADLPNRLPDLHLVFTTLGHGGLLYAAEQLAQYRKHSGVPANIYFDTMRFSVPALRYLGEVLGTDRIIVGSDWPIHRDAERSHIDDALTRAGFDNEQQELIRIGNARRLFALQTNRLTRTGSNGSHT